MTGESIAERICDYGDDHQQFKELKPLDTKEPGS